MRRALSILVLSALLFVPVRFATGATSPRLERALTVQQRLVAERPADPAVWNDLGNLLVIEGRWRDAEEAYVRALELAPANAEARFNLGLLFQQSGRVSLAAEQYAAVVEVEPAHAWALYQLGVIAEERDERRAAIAFYARAFAIDASLSFPQNNPHVIDNGLMTEALLSAERYSSYPEVVPPRHFEEGGRIVDLLLSSERLAEQLAAEPGVKAGAPYDAPEGPYPTRPPVAGEAADVARERDLTPTTGGVLDSPATAGGITVVQPQGTAGSAPVPETSAGAIDRRPVTVRPDPQGRDLDQGRDVDPGRDGGVVTRPETTIVVPPVTTGSPQAPPRGRFRPGSNSTGQLDLRLLPEPPAPAERLAALPGSRG